MSKRTKRCPNCGAPIANSETICRKCKAAEETSSGRIEELPRPIHPEEEPEPIPRPVETAHKPEMSYEEAAAKMPRKKNTWQLVTVLAVIAVILVIAIVLVIKMNQPAAPAQESDTYDAVHVINSDGEEITATDAPTPEEGAATDAPEASDTPEATDAPEADGAVDATDAPTATDAAETEQTDYTVTAASDVVYVTGSGVNLRKGPSTTYDVIASLSSGTELQRTGTVDGWSQVEYNGSVGYISNSLISTTKPSGSTATTTTTSTNYTVTESTATLIVTSDANLRTGPGTDYSVSSTVDAGTVLECTGASGSWSRVSYNGAELFIASSLVTEGSDDAGTTVKVTAKANVRSGAGTGYTVLGVAAVGDSFTVIAHTSSNWYEIIYNGIIGYIAGNLVSAG